VNPREVLIRYARANVVARRYTADELLPGDVFEIDGRPEVFRSLDENEIDVAWIAGPRSILVPTSAVVLARPPVPIDDWVFDGLEMIADGRPAPTAILFENQCWKCSRLGLAFFVDMPAALITGGEPFKYSGIVREIRLALQDVPDGLRLGTVKKRYSRTVGEAYRSQGCPCCDALWGDFPLQEQAFSITTAISYGNGHDRIRKAWTIDMARLFEP
jgi:hypothetical protein